MHSPFHKFLASQEQWKKTTHEYINNIKKNSIARTVVYVRENEGKNKIPNRRRMGDAIKLFVFELERRMPRPVDARYVYMPSKFSFFTRFVFNFHVFVLQFFFSSFYSIYKMHIPHFIPNKTDRHCRLNNMTLQLCIVFSV